MIYIIGKLKACALRICNFFLTQDHSEAILDLVHQKNVIKSISSYPDMIYIIGKLKACALSICKFVWARDHSEPILLLVHKKMS